MDNLDDKIQYLYFISSVVCNLLSCNKSEIVVRELLKLSALKQKKRRLWWWLVGLLGCFGRLFYSSRAVPQSDFPQGCQTVANCNELVFYVMCDISVIYKTKLHYRTDTLLPASSCYLQLHRFFFFPSYFLFIAEFHKWHFSLFFNYVEDHREFSLQKGKFKLLVWVTNIHDKKTPQWIYLLNSWINLFCPEMLGCATSLRLLIAV